MNLEHLAEQLGYADAGESWITLDKDQRPTDHVLQQAKSAGVTGVYVFRTSPFVAGTPKLPPRPAVYVAQANDDKEARKIHRNVWNLGNVPFLIVVLPNRVRVYKGFGFDQHNEAADIISGALESFHAKEIDSGRIWSSQAANLKTDTRVDCRLLKNLNDLGDKLVREAKVSKTLAHKLIGKYTYIRYLHDRGILSNEWLDEKGIDPRQVLSREATCDGLIALVAALENQFNGRIFPLEDGDVLDDETVSCVASVFGGDEASGQLALDFQVYDFSYIPIETLSLIYEQFLHREDSREAAGAYYTPEPLADYLLAEVNEARPLMPGMRVLDPCCGSGVFLVLAYRRLISQEIARRGGRELSPDELKMLLQQSVYGVERNESACYVTEFSLLLTLLSCIDPPDLNRNKDFKFPRLHNNNIFYCDFFDGDCEFWRKDLRFDWVVGNPPWKELKPKNAEEALREAVALQWMANANRHGRPIARYRTCDAFAWHVTDVLKPNGYVGLIMHATSLTDDQCAEFRREFFDAHEVASVTNFANLAEVLFGKRARVPAATIVYTRASEGQEKPPIVHYGPFAVNQVATLAAQQKRKRAWMITVYENEVQTIDHAEAEEGDADTWKYALWGTYRDRKTVARLKRVFSTTLDSLRSERGWQRPRQGVQLRTADADEEVEYEQQLAELKMLDIDEVPKTECRLTVPNAILKEIPLELRYLRKGRRAGLDVARAPHLFFSINFAAYSDTDFVLPHPQIGLSAPGKDADQLRALSLVLNSSVIRYLLFFHSSSWGVFVSSVGLNAVKAIPVPVMSDSQINELALLQRQMAEAELARQDCVLRGDTPSIQAAIDEAVERVLEVPEDIGLQAREFMQVRYQFNQGKVPLAAIEPPTRSSLERYALRLTQELDEFSGRRHQVRISKACDFILCTVGIGGINTDYAPVVVEEAGKISDSHQQLWSALAQQRSQWVYVQRSLRVFDGECIQIMKAPRLVDWTETQALLDSDDIIAEVLARAGGAE